MELTLTLLGLDLNKQVHDTHKIPRPKVKRTKLSLKSKQLEVHSACPGAKCRACFAAFRWTFNERTERFTKDMKPMSGAVVALIFDQNMCE